LPFVLCDYETKTLALREEHKLLFCRKFTR